MANEAQKTNPELQGKRPWKGVLFPCCGAYGRIYQSLATGRFEGNCPKCGQPAKLGLWAMVFVLLFFMPFLQTSMVYGADLGSMDSNTAQTQPTQPTIRQGLTPIDHEDSSAEKAVSLNAPNNSLLPIAKPSPSDTGSLMGKKTESRDSVRFSIFAQTGVSFLDFGDRTRFAQALDTMHREYLGDALNPKDSAQVKKQNFQNVNFCFPVYAGIDFRLSQVHHIAFGSGLIYEKESVILTDRTSTPHEVYYVIQAFPIFIEWRIGISPRLLTLDEHERFSATLRYWWLLAGTEIYSNWGSINANQGLAGQGWGFSLGYQLLEWKRIRILGDLGITMLHASSDSPWSKVVPDYSEDSANKAKWELGGIQLNLRVNFGILKD